MSILSRVGRIAERAEGLPGRMLEPTSATMGGLALVALAGMLSAHPFKPVSQAVQEDLLGDPNGAKTLLSGSISSGVNDALTLSSGQQEALQGMRTRIKNPNRFSPPGAIVFGMYSSRMGGRVGR